MFIHAPLSMGFGISNLDGEATTNPFYLLGDDDNDDLIQLAAMVVVPAATQPKKGTCPSTSHFQRAKSAKLPSKPLSPAQPDGRLSARVKHDFSDDFNLLSCDSGIWLVHVFVCGIFCRRNSLISRRKLPQSNTRGILSTTMSSRHVFLWQASSRNRWQPLLKTHVTHCKDRVNEVVDGTAAECAAVCCCYPCGLVNMLVLVIYKVPVRLYREEMAISRRRDESCNRISTKTGPQRVALLLQTLLRPKGRKEAGVEAWYFHMWNEGAKFVVNTYIYELLELFFCLNVWMIGKYILCRHM